MSAADIKAFKIQRDKDLKTRAARRPGRAEERRLAREARAGDPVALRRLLESLSGPVYRFGKRFCGDPDDAEDLLQEVLLSLVRTLPEWRGDAALTTWAYTVARRACIRRRRLRAGAPEHLESLEGDGVRPFAEMVADPRSDPAREVERRELADAIERALAELPATQREVVILRDIEGLPAAEVGRILGIEERAVKSRLHRGRIALRARLAGYARPGAAARVAAAAAAAAAPPARRRGCPDTVRLLSRYLEGELDGRMCELMEQHVTSCAACSGACDELRASLVACARLGAGPLPAEVRAAVRGALRRALAERD